MRRGRSLVLLLITLLSLLPRLVAGQESWLDSQQGDWNRPGLEIPAAPPPVAVDSAYCQTQVRPVETAEDAALTAQGWRLFSAYQRGWGITLMGGFVDFDAMCRPAGYQEFVFVDGRFAGTLAPVPMAPRSDGALTDARITSANGLVASYVRYAPTDPLCCPSDETERSPTASENQTRSPVAPISSASFKLAPPFNWVQFLPFQRQRP